MTGINAQIEAVVRQLATIPESPAPLVSCYLDLSLPEPSWKPFLLRRHRELVNQYGAMEKAAIDSAFARIHASLERISANTKGLAIFVRAGEVPVYIALQLPFAIANEISAASLPRLYRLMEAKEKYCRFVILITKKDYAQIIEVNLGRVSAELLENQPELQKRLGREWAKLHYQNHRQDREVRFIREKIAILERLISAGGYSQLIIAGASTQTSKTIGLLPKHLREKVVDKVIANDKLGINSLIAKAINAYIAADELESQSIAQRLFEQASSDGLAVTGLNATIESLQQGRADIIVVDADVKLANVGRCSRCGNFQVNESDNPEPCRVCQNRQVDLLPAREAMARLAALYGCRLEIVSENRHLAQIGGVGCLLRYKING